MLFWLLPFKYDRLFLKAFSILYIWHFNCNVLWRGSFLVLSIWGSNVSCIWMSISFSRFRKIFAIISLNTLPMPFAYISTPSLMTMICPLMVNSCPIIFVYSDHSFFYSFFFITFWELKFINLVSRAQILSSTWTSLLVSFWLLSF